MSQDHVVVQGEHFAAIAAAAGHRDFRIPWALSENQATRSLRKTPHILLPGDKVSVNDATAKEDSAPSEKRTRFKTKGVPLKLRVEIRTELDKPAQGVECTLTVEGQGESKVLDSKGRVERIIPFTSKSGRIIVRDAELALDLDVDIEIGGLHPLDVESGQMQRLNNLGYEAGEAVPVKAGAPPSGSAAASPPSVADQSPPSDSDAEPEITLGVSARAKLRFRSAVEEFQLDHGLKVDGILGAGTKAKLKDVHGC